MKILVTGADGYCGWPIILKLLKHKNDEVIGIDNLARRDWVNEIKSESLLPISDIIDRFNLLKDEYKDRIDFYLIDLTNPLLVYELLKKFKPDVILHLASQPSAPYSQIDVNHANYTQHNNMQMTRNIVYAINELKLDTRLVVTTTTGIYGAPDFPIPEGGLVINKMEIPYPAMAGSWYHMSRCFDSSNLLLAHKQFKIPIIEIRTSIVCGSSTVETREKLEFATRFDYDFYFGVVTNRFVTQAITRNPLTIYGKGNQMKPMISLEDMCSSSVNACYIEEDYKIYNQVQKVISINNIANEIRNSLQNQFNFNIEINHIPNPRVEDEDHHMLIENKDFQKDLANNNIIVSIEESINQICTDIFPYKDKVKNFNKIL